MVVRKADKEGATVVGTMRYISLFSGIEACSVAWEPLGWEPVVFADFEGFPSAVLAHHYPNVPNLGDVTKVNWNEYKGKADVVVGGSPCQSFSVAGKRLGMDDPRGNLALHYARIVREVEPTWFLYENVPGLLSSDGGRDMGALIATLGDIGYGLAWRVLDAQFFGVAQRRRRVFIVGHASGDWRRAAAVLFESEGLSRNPPPRPSKGQDPASAAQVGPGSDRFGRGRVIDTVTAKWAKGADVQLGSQTGGNLHVEQTYVGGDVAHTIHKSYFDKHTTQDARNGVFVVEGEAHTWSAPAIGYLKDDDLAGTITANSGEPGETQTPALVGQRVAWEAPKTGILKDAEVSGTLTANIGAGGESQNPLFIGEPIAFTQNQREEVRELEVAGALEAEPGSHQQTFLAQPQAIGFNCMQDTTEHVEVVPTISTGNQQGISNNAVVHCSDVAPAMTASGPPYDRTGNSRVESDALAVQHQGGLVVRRLTPLECERLQGFPDGYTRIPWNGKDAEDCPDGPRYRALGNSMAVPVMRWIGEGIDMVHRIPVEGEPKSGVQEWL
jgi:DNA (cytosine-5)-methyltransferase 1